SQDPYAQFQLVVTPIVDLANQAVSFFQCRRRQLRSAAGQREPEHSRTKLQCRSPRPCCLLVPRWPASQFFDVAASALKFHPSRPGAGYPVSLCLIKTLPNARWASPPVPSTPGTRPTPPAALGLCLFISRPPSPSRTRTMPRRCSACSSSAISTA